MELVFTKNRQKNGLAPKVNMLKILFGRNFIFIRHA